MVLLLWTVHLLRPFLILLTPSQHAAPAAEQHPTTMSCCQMVKHLVRVSGDQAPCIVVCLAKSICC